MRNPRSIPIARRRAFTLVELIVVIAVIILSLVIIVPAFGRIVESANYSAAVNRVNAAITLARAEAMKGKQAAVVFFFDLETERTTLYIVERSRTAGALTSRPTRCNPNAFVFTPVRGIAPITLPVGMGVYGLALNNTPSLAAMGEVCDQRTRELEWYYGEAGYDTRTSSGQLDAPVERFWIFPRNDARLFIDDVDWIEAERDPLLPEWLTASRYAETFMVRFDERGAILPSVEFGSGANLVDAFVDFPPQSDLGALAVNTNKSGALFDPEEYDFQDTVTTRYALSREAQVRSVDYLAVVDLKRLAEETGIEAPWLVRPASDEVGGAYDDITPLSPNDRKAAFIDGEFAGETTDERRQFPRSLIHRISRWIDDNADVIAFNRSTGEALRRVAQ
jgi:type II secretory pathway pseudopilin PulG